MKCASSESAALGSTSGNAGNGRLTGSGASVAVFATMVGEWLAAHTTQRCASRVPFAWKCRASATEANTNTTTQHHAATTASLRKRRSGSSSNTVFD